MNGFFRGLIVVFALAMIGAVIFVCLASAQEPASVSPSATSQGVGPATTFQITGSVRNAKTLLPGVAVTAANTLTGKKYSVVTSSQWDVSVHRTAARPLRGARRVYGIRDVDAGSCIES